ncbi:MAG: FAD-binding protein [Gammaproteobacteria bacterium]|nr:FAD-binding protein [Rhodocyclaceae bacterium]MBU3908351.1 FAD-binding protein [Gammaproteobacteria bacterium]MBU3987860.1 FAD-binding protein [Gammaproteobacteria bacterium]MBU4004061.1 FAD-binding protein [Gammaproteobacteria bacterium]MBU4020308.1 FAD-binding protein [Gammaproteobacteria bacterium]
MTAALSPAPDQDDTRRVALLARLLPLLPTGGLLSDPEDIKPYECDGLTAYRCLPWCVALPDSEAQVIAVLRVCHVLQVPVVVRGAGTGLSGGATPVAAGVVLSLARFMRIIEIDPLARLARVQPGVRNLAISEAAAPLGLYYAPDPSSQIACTIGGNVAENSGGVHCLKYGLTVHNILKLRVALIDGEVIEIGTHALDSPGYDLLALLIGSEGMLGVVLEATVKLTPRPTVAQVVMASFDDVTQAGNAVAAIIAAGIIPAGLEMMDKPATAAVEAFVHAGYDLSATAILLAESDGTEQEVAEEMAAMCQVLETSGARDLRVSRSDAERLKFWAGRKAAFPAVGRLTPDYLCMDGTIPRKHIAHVLTRIEELAQQHRLRVANVFHAGDGNLHPLIMFDASRDDELDRATALGAAILELSVEVGGTITGEHGVGIEKVQQMCLQFSADELAAFRGVKAAFDPLGLLNPGKAVPTPRHCSEYRLTGSAR